MCTPDCIQMFSKPNQWTYYKTTLQTPQIKRNWLKRKEVRTVSLKLHAAVGRIHLQLHTPQ